jgi:hypothetical protein
VNGRSLAPDFEWLSSQEHTKMLGNAETSQLPTVVQVHKKHENIATPVHQIYAALR